MGLDEKTGLSKLSTEAYLIVVLFVIVSAVLLGALAAAVAK